jgi:(R,R)-butanediol dehydrogenase/meso-butanediol dehydrogenase/diacetyl reductase
MGKNGRLISFVLFRSRPSLCPSQAATGLSVDGTMAEYMVAPAYSYYSLPDSISDKIGAPVGPLSVAFHAVRQGKLQVGNTMTIVGGGSIGCAVVLAAKAAGASKIYASEYSKRRKKMARAMGTTAVIDPAENDPVVTIRDSTGGLGVDLGFDCVGHRDSPPVAIRFARSAGTVVGEN